MSKRDPLRGLTRQPIPPKELKRLFSAAYDKDHRHAAIVAAAIVESVLAKLLQNFVVKNDQRLLSQLFDDRGPLADFHSKILVATAFGFLPDDLALDLHSVKKIRNVFAHAQHEVSFDTPEIANAVHNLTIHKNMTREPRPRGYERNPPNKSIYLVVVDMLCIYMNDISIERCEEPIWIWNRK